MLTQSMAVEWAPYGVRVNSISPGYMKTEMTLPSMAPLFPEWEGLTPMGRLGEPDELRGALLFLASDASSYVTGHDLVVDGGYTVCKLPEMVLTEQSALSLGEPFQIAPGSVKGRQVFG